MMPDKFDISKARILYLKCRTDTQREFLFTSIFRKRFLATALKRHSIQIV